MYRDSSIIAQNGGRHRDQQSRNDREFKEKVREGFAFTEMDRPEKILKE